MVKIELHQNYAWFRIEQALPAETLTTGSYRLRLSYLSDHKGNERLPQIKIIEYTKAGGQTFVRIAGDLRPGSGIRNIDVDFAITTNAYPDRSYRLCVEISQQGSFCFGGLSLIRHEEDPEQVNRYIAPYRTYKFQVSKELQELNDDMDTDMREDPGGWLTRMLHVALRIEDYETAGGLARYVLRHHGRDRVVMEKAGPRVLDTLLALGELDDARRLVIDMASLGIQHDHLTQVGRLLGGPGGRTDRKPRSYALPSGRLDVFSLNRDIEHNRAIFEDMLSHPRAAESRELLWANYLRHFSEADYLSRLNRYLSDNGSPYHIELCEHADNVLQRASFCQRRPLSGLMTGGPLVSVIVASWNAEATLGYAMICIARGDNWLTQLKNEETLYLSVTRNLPVNALQEVHRFGGVARLVAT
ncbi:MAG: hypothetical protein Q4G49_02900 [Paracoccus sp. (in: a-proteobacteria)]|nr:hypothetical protein [Paracoccus sp. (in: a-proteobacteria)]